MSLIGAAMDCHQREDNPPLADVQLGVSGTLPWVISGVFSEMNGTHVFQRLISGVYQVCVRPILASPSLSVYDGLQSSFMQATGISIEIQVCLANIHI